jgi:hypothetical protein
MHHYEQLSSLSIDDIYLCIFIHIQKELLSIETMTPIMSLYRTAILMCADLRESAASIYLLSIFNRDLKSGMLVRISIYMYLFSYRKRTHESAYRFLLYCRNICNFRIRIITYLCK